MHKKKNLLRAVKNLRIILFICGECIIVHQVGQKAGFFKKSGINISFGLSDFQQKHIRMFLVVAINVETYHCTYFKLKFPAVTGHIRMFFYQTKIRDLLHGFKSKEM